MKVFGAILHTSVIINLVIYVHCLEHQITTYNVVKRLNTFYSDLISGRLSANSEVKQILNANSANNYDRISCNNQLEYYMNQFSNESDAIPETWALEMFDSSGKLAEGALYGNKYSLGNFDQCLGIYHDDDVNGLGTIKGQYCLVPMIVNLQAVLSSSASRANTASILTITNGVCVPDTCEPAYVMELIGGVLQDMGISLIPTDPERLCSTDSSITLSTADIFMIAIMTIVVILMIGSTAYDYYTTKTEAPKVELLMAFSVITNGKKLFALDQTESLNVISCLNGIRVLSLVWIILGHTYMTTLSGVVLNMKYTADWMPSIFSMVMGAAHLGVDSFFLMSGLLVTWSVFKELDKLNGRLNIPMMYLHRYLRLTPPLIMTMLFMITVFVHTGVGPLSKLDDTSAINCEKWWWSMLLYIQNYVNPTELCVSHSWYLQVDMQLFILSPLLLIPLWKWGRNVLPVVFTLIFISVGCYFATYYVNDFRISFFNGGGGGTGRADSQPKIYYPTQIRMGPWLVGVLLAYLLIKLKHKKLNISSWYIYGGWLVCFVTMFSIIFGVLHINQPDYPEYILESALYSAMHRVAWSTVVAWIVFACHKGYGGLINSFLSHRMWLPFTRLSYSMYLLSYVLQAYKAKMAKVHLYFSDFNAFYYFWGDFGITLTVAIFWVLAFESPIPILEQVVFRRKLKSPKNVENAPVIEIRTS